MKWALSGTPGTGKTAVSDIIEGKGYTVLRLKDVVLNFVIGHDDDRDSMIVDEEQLDIYVRSLPDDLIVEGHLSHLLGVEGVIILRCHPLELKRRLEIRNWPEKKVQENLEVEALDIILDRALELHKNIWEVDTTGKTAGEVAEEVELILATQPPAYYGNIDWSQWVMDRA